ncbi:FMN-binding protein [Roseibacillus ishigakijimensis]|uniref:FMN-binding protein n=1 Tax=Roseibacillus ishigakijimensis TaxID=454146 RepID=A0A934RP19_9BACT|nr:FMN-binding protein [Roseibacillus ishigakijimensis]MBK1835342.1 FMN-binding protein [Roseibacillus ishigakijimensis]
MLRSLSLPLLALLILLAPSLSAGERVYQKPSDFLHSVFGRQLPATQALTLTNTHQARIKRLIGHPYRASKVRYWRSGGKTAWILEEIGKTEPITTGFVTSGGTITQVRVLIYRESHGYEVAGNNFCKQFQGASLRQDGRLSKSIRNIAGATLSVRALDGLGRVALYLDSIQ